MIDPVDFSLRLSHMTFLPLESEYIKDGQLLSIYLMASYLYYHRDISLMKDCEFDKICARLLGKYDVFKHPHKKLVTRAMLEAGTGYSIPERKYPLMVIGAAMHLAKVKGVI